MSAQDDPGTYYQILIVGRLGERGQEWFDGMDINHNEQGFTVLTGSVADQSQLQGILATIGMLNMTLISVTQVDVKSGQESQTNPNEDDPPDWQ